MGRVKRQVLRALRAVYFRRSSSLRFLLYYRNVVVFINLEVCQRSFASGRTDDRLILEGNADLSDLRFHS